MKRWDFSSEVQPSSDGQGISDLVGASSSYASDPSSLSSSSSPVLSSSSPRLASDLLRLRCCKVTSHGVFPRFLTLNTSQASICLHNPARQSDKRIFLKQLIQIEKLGLDKDQGQHSLLLVFDSQYQTRPIELLFSDSTTWYGFMNIDVFCELVHSLHPALFSKSTSSVSPNSDRVPRWIPDDMARTCMRCSREFSITIRRHHCRYCGGVMCGECSSRQALLPEYGYSKPQRVCEDCFIIIKDWRVKSLTSVSSAASSARLPPPPLAPMPNDLSYPPSAYHMGYRASSPTPHTIANHSSPPHHSSDSVLSYHPNFAPAISASVSSSSSSASASLPAHAMDGGTSSPSSASSPNSTVTIQSVRDELREIYGFVSDENATHSMTDSRMEYLVEMEKQKKRWHQYLCLHTEISKDNELKKLVRRGIPSELRGQIWQILSGSKNKQNRYGGKYYELCLSKAGLNPNSAALADIEKDLHRTFPDNPLYESKEGMNMLRRVLTAYSVHNPKIGYCQSMNFICALALLFMDEEEAFFLLSCIVEDITCVDLSPSTYAEMSLGDASIGKSGLSLGLHGMVGPSRGLGVLEHDRLNNPNVLFYHQSDLAGAHIDQSVFKDLVAEKLPRIHAHFEKLNMPLAPMTVNWFLCLFVNTLPLETCLHIWDVLFYEGVKVIFRASLALLKVNERAILKCTDFEQLLSMFKSLNHDNLDTRTFIKACFDKLWLGSFPQSRIQSLRHYHKFKLEEEMRIAANKKSKLKHKIPFTMQIYEASIQQNNTEMPNPPDSDSGEHTHNSIPQHDIQIDSHHNDTRSNIDIHNATNLSNHLAQPAPYSPDLSSGEGSYPPPVLSITVQPAHSDDGVSESSLSPASGYIENGNLQIDDFYFSQPRFSSKSVSAMSSATSLSPTTNFRSSSSSNHDSTHNKLRRQSEMSSNRPTLKSNAFSLRDIKQLLIPSTGATAAAAAPDDAHLSASLPLSFLLSRSQNSSPRLSSSDYFYRSAKNNLNASLHPSTPSLQHILRSRSSSTSSSSSSHSVSSRPEPRPSLDHKDVAKFY